MRAIILVPRLLFRLLMDVVMSGVRVSRFILRGVTGTAGGFVRYHYAPMPPGAARALVSLVAITPGATVVALDVERREVVLHLLDPVMADTILSEIRRDYEAPLAALFGSGSP